MDPCGHFDALIAERASGPDAPLDTADAARLDAHLAGCARCRAELAAFQEALGLARLPAPTEAERQALAHLPTRVRAELDGHSPLMKALWRLLGLTAVAAGVVVLIANKVVLPGAERRTAERTAAAATTTWKSPDLDDLLARVEKEHPELAVADENGLSRAERLADAAYLRAIGSE